MNFWNKLRFLFSSQPLSAFLSPVPGWVAQLDYRDTFHSPRPGISIQELHTALTRAIEEGQGHRKVAIELEYKQGQLCGAQQAEVSSVRLNDAVFSDNDPLLVLTPDITLVHFQKSGFAEVMQYEESLGPWT